jgi:hypothetical protein
MVLDLVDIAIIAGGARRGMAEILRPVEPLQFLGGRLGVKVPEAA